MVTTRKGWLQLAAQNRNAALAKEQEASQWDRKDMPVMSMLASLQAIKLRAAAKVAAELAERRNSALQNTSRI